MSIVKTLLRETVRLMQIEPNNNESIINNLFFVLDNCKETGVATSLTVRTFANYGFPLIPIYATIYRIPTTEAVEAVNSHRVTYEDVVCIISIFAQDIKLRSQYG